MKIKLLTTIFMLSGVLSHAQFSTGTVPLSGSSRTIKIDTNATTVTLTLTGPSTNWLGVGFGGSSMSSVTDMFIWNSSSNRDYTPTGGYSEPSPDGTQNWTISSDNVAGSVRTVVATRALATAGDYTFTNNSTTIPIIFAEGSSTVLGYHGANPHDAQTLSRSALGVDDFSLNATQIYPNPTTGDFFVKAKTNLEKINVYSQTGSFLKTYEIKDGSNGVEVNINGLQTGIYLIELVNENEKIWKKIIVTN
ncbi:MAG: T9SS type A sorting domain-containing protein [Flavobacterium sp.]|nr:T9SS type A sorting domain-containing protein [Flavobacterium sp.]